ERFDRTGRDIRTLVHRHAGRLVDDQDVLVLVQHGTPQLLEQRRWDRSGWRAGSEAHPGNNDLVALLQAVALLCPASVDAQLPLPQEPEQQSRGDTFEPGAQELVQPSTGMLVVDDDRAGRSGAHSV